jgi:transcriptional antiterminator
MFMSLDNNSTNAKRIISFIAFYEMHICAKSLSKLLNLSERTINYYIRDVQAWIDKPKTNKVFVDSYNKTIEALKV